VNLSFGIHELTDGDSGAGLAPEAHFGLLTSEPFEKRPASMLFASYSESLIATHHPPLICGEAKRQPDFAAVFSDLAPLIQHVGVNKIRLRRMSAVRQKGHYRDGEFM
jgi:hypothetical protein